jgi:hypothetical protein
MELTIGYELEWNNQWIVENDRFEEFLNFDLDLQKLPNKMFFMWDGNYRLKT